MKSNVLLENDDVGELLAADRTRVDAAKRRLGAVDPHVGLEVALGGEGTPTEATAERPVTCVCTVMHQQRAAAAEHAQTDGALVGVEVT